MIAAVSTGKPTVSRNVAKVLKNCSYGTIDSFNEYHTNNRLFGTIEKSDNKKIKQSVKRNKRDPNIITGIKVKLKSSKLKEKQKLKPVSSSKSRHYNNLLLRREITTGTGLAVPISEGEEIVCVK